MRIRSERAGRRPKWPGLPALAALLWLALVLAMVAVSGATGRVFSPCLLKRITGVPCPSCGTTRGTLALLSGDVADAFAMNPLFVAAVVALGAVAALRVLGGRRLRVEASRGERRALFALAAVALAANWAFVIAMGR